MRLRSWNIQPAESSGSERVPELDGIAQAIRTRSADILFMQEARTARRCATRDVRCRLAVSQGAAPPLVPDSTARSTCGLQLAAFNG